jgi:cystathionine beta-synthase
MYSDEWMIEKGFMKPAVAPRTAGELLAKTKPGDLLSVHPDDRAEVAVALLRRHSISQLPVVENGKCVGCIRELTVARLLHQRSDPRQVAVRDVMARPMPAIDEHVDLDEAYRLLSSGNSGVLVLRAGEIAGIITRIDLINFWDEPVEETAATGAAVAGKGR